MKNKREAEPDFFDMLVDVKVWSTVSANERIQTWKCRVTPKRIYTPGGAVFGREGGHELVARKYLYGSTYKTTRQIFRCMELDRRAASKDAP